MDNAGGNRRIGLFGGTFDPVHKGHLAIAEQAAEELRLEQILFIPAPDPPHKRRTGATYRQRVAMLELALVGHSRFSISLLETELSAPSYTIDTLLELRRRLPGQFYFLIGGDSLLELHRWHQYQKLLSLTCFIVISRPGISLTAMQQAVGHLPGFFQPDRSHQSWVRSDGTEIFLLINQVKENISSTMIRSELKKGGTPEGTDIRVQEYIQQEKLYRAAS